MAGVADKVTAHYGGEALFEAIVAALRVMGKDLDRLTPDDLSPADEFHGRGRTATIELADLLKITAKDRVIDVGCGLGGPSRYLAHRFGCKISGIDLTPGFIRTAQMLTRLLKLEHLVDHQVASALDLPFPDQSFDVVWSQNVAMNIADRRRYYGEMRRVLKPGGRLGLSEVLSGSGGPPLLPMPWASDPAASHCFTEAEVRQAMADAGLRIVHWVDQTEDSRAQGKARVVALDTKPPPLGLHLILGARMGEIYRTGLRNYEEDRMRPMQAVLERLD
jgi:ubiquinone/menaquinone biosynthesis C-methylase UbiE